LRWNIDPSPFARAFGLRFAGAAFALVNGLSCALVTDIPSVTLVPACANVKVRTTFFGENLFPMTEHVELMAAIARPG